MTWEHGLLSKHTDDVIFPNGLNGVIHIKIYYVSLSKNKNLDMFLLKGALNLVQSNLVSYCYSGISYIRAPFHQRLHLVVKQNINISLLF